MKRLILLAFFVSSAAFSAETTRSVPLEVGINAHSNPHNLGTIREIRAGWVRGGAPWSDINPKRGVWKWEVMDAFVNAAEREGLKIAILLYRSPPWVSSSGAYNAVPNAAAWKEYVRRTVTRYRGRVHGWMIWNEPNLGNFWRGSVDQYFNVLLKPAHQIIKSLDSSSPVIGPEIAMLYKTTIHPETFMKRLAALGGKPYIDIVSMHAYGANMPTFRKLMLGFYRFGVLYKPGVLQILQRSGFFGMPFWMSEWGWDVRKVGEEGQANNLMETIRLLASLDWVHGSVTYDLMDDPRYDHQFAHGILRADGSERPAVNALREVIAEVD